MIAEQTTSRPAKRVGLDTMGVTSADSYRVHFHRKAREVWPWFESLQKAAGKNERAQKKLDAWNGAREHHRRILGALYGCEASEVVRLPATCQNGECPEAGNPVALSLDKAPICAVCGFRLDAERARVETVEVAGLGVVVTAGRDIRADWMADPARLGAKMAGCCQEWRVCAKPDGGFISVPIRCGSPLCPLCCRYNAQRAVSKWGGRIAALAAAGFEVMHLTLTAPPPADVPTDRPVILTDREKQYSHDSVPDSVDIMGAPMGYDVQGEPLLDSYNRVRGAWHALRNNRGTRQWWRDSVLCSLDAIEWTGSERTPDGFIPRWHTHIHVLIVLTGKEAAQWRARSGGIRGRKDRGWFARLVREWCALNPGAKPDYQVLVPVPVESLDGALVEVLKYPFKPGELTRAQIVACLAQTKGLRTHLPGGALHGASSIGRLASHLAHRTPISLDLYEKAGDAGLTAAIAISEAMILEQNRERPAALFVREEDGAKLTKPLTWQYLVKQRPERLLSLYTRCEKRWIYVGIFAAGAIRSEVATHPLSEERAPLAEVKAKERPPDQKPDN